MRKGGGLYLVRMVAVGLLLVGCGQVESWLGIAPIEEGARVAIRYELRADGIRIESTGEGKPFEYTQGAGEMLDAFEREMAGLKKGDKKSFALPPEAAFGPYEPSKRIRLPKTILGDPSKLRPGREANLSLEGRNVRARVLKIGRSFVDFDLNHPLAGRTLEFEVEVVDVGGA